MEVDLISDLSESDMALLEMLNTNMNSSKEKEDCGHDSLAILKKHVLKLEDEMITQTIKYNQELDRLKAELNETKCLREAEKSKFLFENRLNVNAYKLDASTSLSKRKHHEDSQYHSDSETFSDFKKTEVSVETEPPNILANDNRYLLTNALHKIEDIYDISTLGEFANYRFCIARKIFINLYRDVGDLLLTLDIFLQYSVKAMKIYLIKFSLLLVLQLLKYDDNMKRAALGQMLYSCPTFDFKILTDKSITEIVNIPEHCMICEYMVTLIRSEHTCNNSEIQDIIFQILLDILRVQNPSSKLPLCFDWLFNSDGRGLCYQYTIGTCNVKSAILLSCLMLCQVQLFIATDTIFCESFFTIASFDAICSLLGLSNTESAHSVTYNFIFLMANLTYRSDLEYKVFFNPNFFGAFWYFCYRALNKSCGPSYFEDLIINLVLRIIDDFVFIRGINIQKLMGDSCKAMDIILDNFLQKYSCVNICRLRKYISNSNYIDSSCG